MKFEEGGAFSITIRPKVVLLQLLVTGLFLALVFYSGLFQYQSVQNGINGKLVRTRWYNEDLESVFNIKYLPFAIDDPRVEKGVKEILDRHDVRMDRRYDTNMESYYEEFGKIIARGPLPNDKSVYIAKAGKKGHGVYAGRLLKAGEFVSVYTGIRVLKDENRDSTYQWSYKVTDEYGHRFHLDTDSRLSGNMMRFVNDNPGGAGRNCKMIEVCVVISLTHCIDPV
jgi:hypothetical protein